MSGPQKIYVNPPASVEVEIADGWTFQKLPPTKSVQRKIAEAVQSAEETVLSNEAEDEAATLDLFAGIYDAMLKPCGSNRRKASTWLRQEWDADRLDVTQIIDQLERLGDIRPT